MAARPAAFPAAARYGDWSPGGPRRTVRVMRAVLAVLIVAAAAVTGHSPLAVAGLIAAVYLGARYGIWFALQALGEFERRQRARRVRNWRRGGGG